MIIIQDTNLRCLLHRLLTDRVCVIDDVSEVGFFGILV
jgi:hypothetical protein